MRLLSSFILAFGVTIFLGSAAAQEIRSHVASQTAQPAGSANAAGGLDIGSKCDSKAPLDVDADSFQGDLNNKTGTYLGNVIVTQTTCKLRADKVTVNIVQGKPDKVFAYGNIVFTTTSGTATGDNGVYDLADPPTVTLTGKVVLVKEKSVMRGTKLVIDVNTGIAHLTSQGAQGGRVQAILQPAQKQQSEEKKPAAGAKPPRTN